MRSRYNRYVIINKVTEHLENFQGVTGLSSWTVHDADTAFITSKVRHVFNKWGSRVGYYRNRKPRVEIC